MRIGLAQKLGLKPIAPSSAEGYVSTWDVGRVEAGHQGDLSAQARPVGGVGAPPAASGGGGGGGGGGSGGAALQAQLAQYLADGLTGA